MTNWILDWCLIIFIQLRKKHTCKKRSAVIVVPLFLVQLVQRVQQGEQEQLGQVEAYPVQLEELEVLDLQEQ